MKVRFRLYSCERMKRERLLGECTVSFARINLELEANMWLPLEPRTSSPVSYAHIGPRVVEYELHNDRHCL